MRLLSPVYPCKHCFSSLLVFAGWVDLPLSLYLQGASIARSEYLRQSIDHSILWLSVTLVVSLTLLCRFEFIKQVFNLCTLSLSYTWLISFEQDLLLWMNWCDQTSICKNTVSHSVSVSFPRVKNTLIFYEDLEGSRWCNPVDILRIMNSVPQGSVIIERKVKLLWLKKIKTEKMLQRLQ